MSSAFDADLAQLAYERQRLHALASKATPGNIPANFATLDRVVSFRIDQLATIMAMRDTPKPPAVTHKRNED